MEEKESDRRFVVCVVKDKSGFTYGKSYEVLHTDGSTYIDIIDDNGNRPMPSLYGVEPLINYKESRRYFGSPQKKVDYFIPLDQWRESQLNKIGI